jgi:hypothetical protein
MNSIYKLNQSPLEMNTVDHKKTSLVADLLRKEFESVINWVKIGINSDEVFFIAVEFKTKIQVNFKFALYNTWNDIKRKVKKLSESDGICVVCFEQEKVKKHKQGYMHFPTICGSCCEYICRDCFTSAQSHKCPVCRECLIADYHSINKETCDCAETAYGFD